MRQQFIAAVVIVGAVIAPVVAAQAPPGKSRISACALLPTDLVVKVGGINPQAVKILKPEEEAMGTTGSACEYGDIRLQVDPFARSEGLRKSPGKDWQPVSGVGDTAFFHANGRNYAELMVWTGAHHFTIQFGVPVGSTPEAIKPKTIELANAIIPKLR
jgi:hypothetical protein